jgi:hypothetical protein
MEKGYFSDHTQDVLTLKMVKATSTGPVIYLYTMTLLMCIQESLGDKIFAANCTVVGPLPCMIAFVNSESRELGE